MKISIPDRINCIPDDFSSRLPGSASWKFRWHMSMFDRAIVWVRRIKAYCESVESQPKNNRARARLVEIRVMYMIMDKNNCLTSE